MSNASIDSLLESGGLIPPPEAAVAQAWVPDYEALYRESMADIPAFWERIARELEWFTPWRSVVEGGFPGARWFEGATCNISVNCLDRHLAGPRKNKIALTWLGEDGTERQFSFAQLARLVYKTANALKSLGVRKGDRVCIYLPLTPEGMAAMLACARIGAIHSVVYAGLGAGALRSRIEDARAAVILTADVGVRRGKDIPLKPIVDEAIQGLDFVRTVAVWWRRDQQPLGPGEVDFQQLVDAASPVCEPEPMAAEDPLFILYTSGTTGTPKGAVYCHGGYAVGTSYLSRIAFDLKEDDVYWCTSDIGWIVGHSTIVYGPLINGTTLLVREGAPDFPDPGAFWSIVERYGVTKIFTAPTTLRMFMRLGDEWPNRYDLSTLRLLICAGEPLNPEALRWAHRVIGRGRIPICDNWWQTETGAPTIATLPAYPAKAGRAGKPMPGISAAVLDRDGNPLPPNQGGLLVLKNGWPHMFRAIWGNDARYQAYWNTIPGVYVAGDVAFVDDDGYIAVLGRSDDVLNVAGHRIGTADVESALVGHPAVAEAAAIGIPDEIKGEAIKCFVILKVGQTPSDQLAQELIQHVRHELGPIASPSAIDFPARLPKTRSGKIMRRVLKAQELGQDPGDISTIEE